MSSVAMGASIRMSKPELMPDHNSQIQELHDGRGHAVQSKAL